MKKILLILCLFTFCQAYGQEKGTNDMNFYVGFGNGGITQAELEGGPGYDAKNSFLFGLSYQHYLNRHLAVEAGVSYLETEVERSPAISPNPGPSTTLPLDLVSFRAGLKYSFLKYLFINGGLLLDLEVENEVIDNQNGLGLGIGLGAEYVFTSGFKLFANPYLNQHALIPFQKEDYHGRLLDAGIRLGVGYRF